MAQNDVGCDGPKKAADTVSREHERTIGSVKDCGTPPTSCSPLNELLRSRPSSIHLTLLWESFFDCWIIPLPAYPESSTIWGRV